MGPGGGGCKRLNSEINVTPLVDVMLVLLIIFMVTAPMMTQGLEVDLPRTTAKALRQDEEPLVVTMNMEREISLGKVKINRTQLVQELSALPEEKKKQSIYLQVDQKVPYGEVVAIMADIKRAGFDKLGMVTSPAEEKR